MNRNWKRWALVMAFAVAILLGGAQLACKPESEALAFHGTVEVIDRSARTLKVNHRNVPGYMDAMTMTFPVDNLEILKSIKAGDSIQATVYKGTFRLYNVQLAETAMPASLRLQPSSPALAFRAPQLASSGRRVALAFGSGNNIFVSTSLDNGASFSSPVLVAEGSLLPLSRHRGPHVAFAGDVLVVTAVIGKTEAHGPYAHGLPSDGDLFAWHSRDNGKTWTKAVRINDVPAAPREGLHTLAASPNNDLFAAWLDLRNGATRLYGASSLDSGASWSRNILIYDSAGGSICQCCSPSAAFSESGSLKVMWRNALKGARDLYFARASNSSNFQPAEKLGKGTWKIEACPMDGGGMSHIGERTVTAWRRGDDIFLAEPGQPETRLGTGKDVALAAGNGQLYAVWVNGSLLESFTSGKSIPGKSASENLPSGKRQVLSEKAAMPSIAALSMGGALVAWEESGAISLRQLR